MQHYEHSQVIKRVESDVILERYSILFEAFRQLDRQKRSEDADTCQVLML